MGVTGLRTYFTQIIAHTSVNFHRIPTNVGTEIRLNEHFNCAKCQPDPSTNSCFMADFCEVCEMKMKKKAKKFKRYVVRSYLGNGWSELLQIWYVDSPNWPALL